MQTPEEQAKQIVEQVLETRYIVPEGYTDILCRETHLVDAITAALQAEGDRRAKEARERALEDAASLVEQVHETYVSEEGATFIASQVRSLKGKDNGRH